MKFWLFIKEYANEYPNGALSRILKIGLEINLKYLRYYENLVSRYVIPDNCEKILKIFYKSLWKQKLVNSLVDSDSKLGTYYSINPLMKPFIYVPNATENERILISRYRTGSHSLAIEIGRFSNTPREQRFCSCGQMVQTIRHIFMECHLTRDIVVKDYISLKEIFEDDELSYMLLNISARLKISNY